MKLVSVVRRSFLAALISLPTALFLGTSEALRAQPTLALDSFQRCSGCSLRSLHLLTIGDREGDGAILGDFVRLSYDAVRNEFLMYTVGSTQLQLFDRNGRFLHAFGREGEGPGELLSIRHAAYENGRIIVLDARRGRWVTYARSGEFLSESPAPVAPGEFYIVRDDLVVLGSMTRTPAGVGYPLHLVSIGTGEIVRHFGSRTGEFNTATSEPYSLNIRLKVDRASESTWVARPNRLRLEEWTLDGRLTRLVFGEPAWLQPVTSTPRFGVDPPAALLNDFAVTSEDWLWTMTIQPDRRWRQAVLDAAGSEPDHVQYMDMRVDAWDLQGQRHLGTIVFDNPAVQFVDLGDGFAYYHMDLDSNLIPRIVVSRLQVEVEPFQVNLRTGGKLP